MIQGNHDAQGVITRQLHLTDHVTVRPWVRLKLAHALLQWALNGFSART